MPAEVEGCSCYFSENKEQFGNEKNMCMLTITVKMHTSSWTKK